LPVFHGIKKKKKQKPKSEEFEFEHVSHAANAEFMQ
jgi:hypothetical protein